MIKTTHIKKYPNHIEKTNRSTLRKVVMTILERDLKNIVDKRVLEVGCGDWDFAKKIIEKNKCEWYGFEPINLSEKNLTIVKGSVKNIPYHNNSFDIVLCNQTMEHWFEYGVSLKRALKEIHRVLKPGGVLMINAPIHFHGHPIFLKGDLKKIRNLFKSNLWKIKLFEKCDSPNKIKSWKILGSKGWKNKVGYPDFLIPHHKKAFSYVLNIHVIKKQKTKNIVRKEKSRYLKIILRFIKSYLRFFY